MYVALTNKRQTKCVTALGCGCSNVLSCSPHLSHPKVQPTPRTDSTHPLQVCLWHALCGCNSAPLLKSFRSFHLVSLTNHLKIICAYMRSRDSSVGTATGYGVDGRGSILVRVKFFSTPQRLDRLWGLPSLLSNGYLVLSSRG
jgi:hypothetical protein